MGRGEDGPGGSMRLMVMDCSIEVKTRDKRVCWL